MRYEFIEAHQRICPVQWLCEFLQVSRSGYYAYLKHQPSQREEENTELVKEIKDIHQQSKQRYGSPRIQKTLHAQGKDPSLGRIKRLMRKNGIYSIVTPDFKPRVQEEVKPGLEMTNLLKQEAFEMTTINQVWYVDITYIHTLEGWLYLAGVIDGFSKRVVGYAKSL